MVPIRIDCKSDQPHYNGVISSVQQYTNHLYSFKPTSIAILPPSTLPSLFRLLCPLLFCLLLLVLLPISSLPSRQASLLASPESRGMLFTLQWPKNYHSERRSFYPNSSRVLAGSALLVHLSIGRHFILFMFLRFLASLLMPQML